MRPSSSSEGALWATSLMVSLFVNGLAFLVFVGVMGKEWMQEHKASPSAPEPPQQVVAVIRPEMLRPQLVKSAASTAAATPPPAQPKPQGFLRTSPAQESEPPAQARFIGERNTRATSDAPPVAGAPAIPSQTGIDPRHEQDLETTESRYQDGRLNGGAPKPTPLELATPAIPPSSPLPDPSLAVKPEAPKPQEPPPVEPPAMEKKTELARSSATSLVREIEERPSMELAKKEPSPEKPEQTIRQEELPKPQAEKALSDAPPSKDPKDLAENRKPKPKAESSPQDPAFRGFQQKTKLRGSISRRGTSAMDVEDSPLGRYQAQLSRAIEKEWQLNCVRYRDLIIPGSLTVSFFIDPQEGKVKAISFVNVFKAGEAQKGFTIKAIRDAELPPMPKNVSKELGGEPLEVTYNFHF